MHRAAGSPHGGHRDILEAKAQRLVAIDEELRALEARLGTTAPAETVVRQPGIGGTCPTCGELHGSDAGWCSHCGTPLSDRARRRAEEATDRAIADRQQRERDAAAAAQAAAAPPAPGRAGGGAERRAQARARAVHRAHRRARGRHRRAARRREGRARRVPAGCADERSRRARRLGAPAVSTVETPPPPTPVERRCPRCDARLSAEQEWCLECGAAVGTRIAEPRGWRASLAVVGVLLALALLAVILAIVELAGPAETVTAVPQTPTPTPSVVAPTATPTPSVEGEATPEGQTTPAPSASPEGGASAPAADLAEWPEGRTAWTVVLNSSGTREDAERLGAELAGKNVPDVGVLDSNDFESLGPDSFVVFSGTYEPRRRPRRRSPWCATGPAEGRRGGSCRASSPSATERQRRLGREVRSEPARARAGILHAVPDQ